MFRHFIRFNMTCQKLAKKFSTSTQNNFNVCVIGSAGGIGQPLSMLLKQELMITCLNVYDIAKVNSGVAVDLSHINTTPIVQAYTGADELCTALCGCHVVVIPAGMPRKPGMSRDDLFNSNASLVYDFAWAVARNCPCALVAIITNPVNSMVPIFSEVLNMKKFKVCVIGSAGGIGQPLSMLLKHEPLITCLSMYDITKFNPGVGVDVSHISTRPYVYSFSGLKELPAALCGSQVVIVPAGLPRKPGMARDDLFKANASLIYDLACAIGAYSRFALVAIVTNPVNSMVPIMSEVLMRCGCYDPCKIFGVTTLDVVRAATFVGQISCLDPSCIDVPVIGGHAGKTIVPVLSQSRPTIPPMKQEEIEKLTHRIQEAGTEVVKAKAGGGSATLSMAFAGARFVRSLLKGLSGESVVECAYVRSCATDAAYFSNPLVLGRCGIERNLGYGALNAYEAKQLNEAVPILVKNIEEATKFVNEKANIKPPSKSDSSKSAKTKC